MKTRLDKPFFSIITCTYNSRAWLSENIKSVRSQTYQNFEHIFIDGYSSDDSLKIIRKYGKTSSNIGVYAIQAKGVANAFNEGIRYAKGDWIVFLNSDDTFYDDDVLKNVHGFIQNDPGFDLVYGKSLFINNLGEGNREERVIPHRYIYRKFRYCLLLLTNYIPHQSVYIKKSVFSKYGKFDEKLRSSMDYEMWLRLSRNNVKTGFVNILLSRCKTRKSSISVTTDLGLEHNYLINKYVKSKILRNVLKKIHNTDRKRSFY